MDTLWTVADWVGRVGVAHFWKNIGVASALLLYAVAWHM